MSNTYTYVDASIYNPVAGWIVGCQIEYTYVDSSNYNPVAGWIVGCQIGIHMLILVTTTLLQAG